MGEHFSRMRKTAGGLVKDKKKNIIAILILVIATSLFFSNYFHKKALAKNRVIEPKLQFAYDVPRTIPEELVEKEDKACYEKAKTEITVADKRAEAVEEDEYKKIVEGHPIEAMVSEIAKKDRTVSAFLIGIAKKESDWGKHSPKKDGRDCFNYWGYRGKYNATDSGYSCFDTPEQAVIEVGGRIEKLVGQKINTPERMIVWKCGSSCEGHDPSSVKKWISDVSIYFNKLNS